jgi:predicted AAA+ superfamily ATPase
MQYASESLAGRIRILNLGKRLINAPKIYFCDNGLNASLLNIDSIEAPESSVYLGNIWENFVFSEFLKEGFIAGKDFSVYNPLYGFIL